MGTVQDGQHTRRALPRRGMVAARGEPRRRNGAQGRGLSKEEPSCQDESTDERNRTHARARRREHSRISTPRDWGFNMARHR